MYRRITDEKDMGQHRDNTNYFINAVGNVHCRINGRYVSSNRIEELSNDNIVKERTIQQQNERIRELQHMKQLKEIYG